MPPLLICIFFPTSWDTLCWPHLKTFHSLLLSVFQTLSDYKIEKSFPVVLLENNLSGKKVNFFSRNKIKQVLIRISHLSLLLQVSHSIRWIIKTLDTQSFAANMFGIHSPISTHHSLHWLSHSSKNWLPNLKWLFFLWVTTDHLVGRIEKSQTFFYSQFFKISPLHFTFTFCSRGVQKSGWQISLFSTKTGQFWTSCGSRIYWNRLKFGRNSCQYLFL